ncbi:hypothetical protein AGMMS50267_11570 [Spirochaetia bacterium]|nr:hypothetical protein AGMMS50267_11570 [Spirochaetia bacterium]
MIDFLKNNYQWIFSGIGVFIIGLFIASKVINKNKQNQNIKNHSTGYQANGSMTINGHKNEPESK